MGTGNLGIALKRREPPALTGMEGMFQWVLTHSHRGDAFLEGG